MLFLHSNYGISTKQMCYLYGTNILFVLYKYVVCTVLIYVICTEQICFCAVCTNDHSTGLFFTFAVSVMLLNFFLDVIFCGYLRVISCQAFMHLFHTITILQGHNCIANYTCFHIY